MYEYIHIYIYTYIHIYTYNRIPSARAKVGDRPQDTHTHTCIHIYICTYIHIYIYVYPYMCTHKTGYPALGPKWVTDLRTSVTTKPSLLPPTIQVINR